jgi:hypothetical protein
MALLLHFDSNASASVLATSSTQIETMADAYAETQASLTQVLGVLGSAVDAQARADAFAGAAASYVQALYGGASAETAYETYAVAALDALIEAGTTAEAVASATAGAGTVMSNLTAQGTVDAAVRLSTVRAITKLNLRARQRLAESIDAGSAIRAQAQVVADALVDARAAVDAASTVGAISMELGGVVSSSHTLVLDAILALATDLSPLALVELEAVVGSAFVTADMRSALEGSVSATAAAQAAATYSTEVKAAAQAVVDAMAESAASVSVETMTRLLIAAGAGNRVS